MYMTLRIEGQRFGRLTVVERIDIKTTSSFKWRCLCDCGNETIVIGPKLINGHTSSCGCLLNERRGSSSITHGLRKSAEYMIWCGIKSRCLNENSQAYERYGGRGISMDPEWIESFSKFYSDVGPRPGPEYSIDRKDNNLGYTPGNCHWVTDTEQCNNRRSNKMIEYLGETKSMADWSRHLGVGYIALSKRLRAGRTMEEAVNFKNRRYRENK